MNCTDCRHELEAYVDGELSPDQQSAVQSHLQGCAECRVHEQKLRALDTMLLRDADIEPKAVFDYRVKAALRDEQRGTSLWDVLRRRPQFAAGMLAAIVAISVPTYLALGRTQHQ